jgi:hypothetical protein
MWAGMPGRYIRGFRGIATPFAVEMSDRREYTKENIPKRCLFLNHILITPTPLSFTIRHHDLPELRQ